MSIDSRPNSLSSSLMMGINLYRNKPGYFNKLQAAIAYPFVSLVASIETIAASIFTILSSLSLPFTDAYFKNSATWLKSASFSIVWSLFDFLINPFVFVVVADEQSAKYIAISGDLMMLPFGAII